MKIVHTIADARTACHAFRRASPDPVLGLVPTMGALHEGHLSLIRAARQTCDAVVASIFVNPTQFGPTEDLAKYPRTFEADCKLLEGEGVDLLFAPTAPEMYPNGGLGIFIDPGDLGNRLDGQSRPGHFRGVTTVVGKLFGILTPDRAFFGQKDAAQVAVLRAMVRDLDMPVELVVCPIVRDADGLALSSRNRYLTTEQHTQALALSAALRYAQQAFWDGERDPASLIGRMISHLTSPAIRIDYVEIIHADTLLPVARAAAGTLLAIAAWVGETRLIDNVLLADAPVGQGK